MADISLGVCLVLTSVVACQAMCSFNLDVLFNSQFIPDQCFHNNFCVVPSFFILFLRDTKNLNIKDTKNLNINLNICMVSK